MGITQPALPLIPLGAVHGETHQRRLLGPKDHFMQPVEIPIVAEKGPRFLQGCMDYACSNLQNLRLSFYGHLHTGKAVEGELGLKFLDGLSVQDINICVFGVAVGFCIQAAALCHPFSVP